MKARNAAVAALKAAQETEAAALISPPPLAPAPLAPEDPKKALEQPATETEGLPVRGSGTALKQPKPDVSGWWIVISGSAPGLRDPADRAAWLAPRIETQAQEHSPDAIRQALWENAPSNRRGAWLSLRLVTDRAKSLSKRTMDWWDRLIRSPLDQDNQILLARGQKHQEKDDIRF